MSCFFKKIIFTLFVTSLTFSSFVSAQNWEIETERLRLRPWQPVEDTNVWAEHECRQSPSTPVFARLLPWLETDLERSITLATEGLHEQKETYECVVEDLLKGHLFVPTLPLATTFAITLKESCELVGYFAIDGMDEEGFCEFGWAFAPDFRGRGLGSELLETLIPFYNSFVGIEVPDYSGNTTQWRVFKGLIAEVNVHNPASMYLSHKYMTPFDMEIQNYYGLLSVGIYFASMPRESELSESERAHIINLFSRDESKQSQALSTLLEDRSIVNPWCPVVTQFLLSSYVVPIIRGNIAAKRGLPAPDTMSSSSEQ